MFYEVDILRVMLCMINLKPLLLLSKHTTVYAYVYIQYGTPYWHRTVADKSLGTFRNSRSYK